MYGDAPELSGGQGAGTGAGGLSKLGKLRKASNAQNARVVGKSLPKTSTFGCSVASSTGQKRKVSSGFSNGSTKKLVAHKSQHTNHETAGHQKLN